MTRMHWFTALAVFAGSLALGGPAHEARAEGLFPHLTGSWSGSGQVRLEQGKSEQITCKAYYTPKQAGSGLALAIRCASSSYKIEMRATLSQQNGRVAGHWEERTFNASGAVDGRATDSSLNLAISGAVSGTMSVRSSEATQQIEIKTLGTGLVGVVISLART
jgi:hypothetical protein